MNQSANLTFNYESLARKIALAIATVAFVPYALTFMLFYLSYSESIRSQVVTTLTKVVESHKRTIDDFLTERLANLKNVANMTSADRLTDPEALRVILASLREAYGPFQDLGLFQPPDRLLAHVGPEAPKERDLAAAPWLREALARGHYVGDVELSSAGAGPQFVVAIKVNREGREFVLRSTIDATYLESVAGEVRLGRTGQAFIVNRDGLYQTQTGQGQRLAASGLKMPELFSGVHVATAGGSQDLEVLQAQTWLEGGRWLLICRQDADEAFRPLYTTRRWALFIAAVGGALVIGATVFFTQRLVNQLAQADREKELLNQQIIQADKLASLGMLVTGVAHEINNPLAIMMEEAGWLQDLISDDPQGTFHAEETRAEFDHALGKIKLHGRRCKEITHLLLSFARQSDLPHKEPTPINGLIRNVTGLVERLARSARVGLALDLADDLPLVSVSPTELEQVLMNLVKNAVDAMEKTGGTITIRTRSAGSELEIVVEDDGPGIPESLRARVFDPFFTTKPVGKGTGLGLSICYGIISRLGGSIELAHREGPGTVFVVKLPIQEVS